jgi:raffinose/stachyose/melibiose transport system substrate-binding protein
VAATGSASGASSHRQKGGEPTITVWDQNTVGNLNPIYNHLVSMFEAKYHVKVNRITKPFTQILQQQKLALSGPNPPDIVQSNQGYGTMGPEVAAHLIIPLTKYANEYHWASCQPASILNGGDFTSNGKQFGSGPLYGISDTIGGPVAVYYNKSILKRLGVKLPLANLAAFEAVLAKAKAAKITPIEFGDLEQWPGIHEYQILWNIFAPGPAPLLKYIFGTGSATFDTPWAKEAATTLQNWAKSGYYENGYLGISYETAWETFAKGGIPFLISGPWLNGSLYGAMGKNLGVMFMPPAHTGGAPIGTNSGNNSYVVASKVSTQDQALAAEYLNFITCSKEASDYFLSQAQIPVYLPANANSYVPAGSSLADWLAIWKSLEKDNGSIMFMDLSTLQGTTLIGQQVQELMGGETTVTGFVDTIEADYSEFHTTLNQ